MSSELEARIVELEIKVSFADDLLEELNTLLARQQQQIEALQRELRSLREHSPAAAGNLSDELPPHY